MALKYPDILILGTGRSGTSTTARVLHERFGVCFGHSKGMLQDFRGEMVYEDMRLKAWLERCIWGLFDIEEWLRRFSELHEDCMAPLTGVKLLRFADLSAEQLLALKPKLIIRTRRPREECVASWERYSDMGRDWAEWYYDQAEAKLEAMRAQIFLQREHKQFAYTTITFSTRCRLTDEQVEDDIEMVSGDLFEEARRR